METPQGILVAIVLSLVTGGGGLKFIEFLVDVSKGRAKERRAEVDRATKLAAEAIKRAEKAEAKVFALERDKRLLIESLHDHRTVMQESGQWMRESLPPFIKE